jgi:outer membrane murein-binding lipoprotein Lpp
MTLADFSGWRIAQPVRGRAITAATVLSAFVLAGCGSSATSSGASGTAEFCGTFRPISAKVNAARDQINTTPSSQTLQASFSTIVTQVKMGLDASPPAAVKGDIQTFYDAVVQTQSQLAAIGYDLTKLQKPLALQDPKSLQAGKAVEQWSHVNCGTPLSAG